MLKTKRSLKIRPISAIIRGASPCGSPEQVEEEGFVAQEKEISFSRQSNQPQDEIVEYDSFSDINNLNSKGNSKQVASLLLKLPEANPLLDPKKQIETSYNKQFISRWKPLEVQSSREEYRKSNQIQELNITHQEKELSEKRRKQELQKQIGDHHILEKYFSCTSAYSLVYSKYNTSTDENINNCSTKRGFNVCGFSQSFKTLSTNCSSNIKDVCSDLRDMHQYRNLDKITQPYIVPNNSQNQQLNNNSMSDSSAQFDSRFESGNLMYAFQKQQNGIQGKFQEYDLLLCNDINSKGYSQWFYFCVSGVPKGNTIRLNIVNNTKKQSLFKSGMKPTFFSVKKNAQVGSQKTWERQGCRNIRYNETITSEGMSSYFTLSFEYTFQYDEDQVYFAMSEPYTYTQLLSFIDRVQNDIQQAKEEYQSNILFSSETLTQSISGLSVPVLTVTNKDLSNSKKNPPDNKGSSISKRIAFIIARQHPGEAVSSFLMQGFIEEILSDSLEAKYLRDRYIFKIIPMVNPDGVVFGNFRCNLSGVDLNRQWMNPSRILHPCVYSIKRLIMEYQRSKHSVDYFIDLHGHSKKLNSFVYACKVENDEQACCIFPMMLSKANPMYDYASCTFGLDSWKENTARGIAWNCGLNKPNIFTIETSFFGYSRINRQQQIQQQSSSKGQIILGQPFSSQDLLQLGKDISNVMFVYHVEIIGDVSFLDYVRIKYPSMRKQEILDQIGITNCDIKDSLDDSGSDSDPEGDELDNESKIQNVFGIKLAKEIGFISQKKNKKVDKIQNNVKQLSAMHAGQVSQNNIKNNNSSHRSPPSSAKPLFDRKSKNKTVLLNKHHFLDVPTNQCSSADKKRLNNSSPFIDTSSTNIINLNITSQKNLNVDAATKLKKDEDILKKRRFRGLTGIGLNMQGNNNPKPDESVGNNQGTLKRKSSNAAAVLKKEAGFAINQEKNKLIDGSQQVISGQSPKSPDSLDQQLSINQVLEIHAELFNKMMKIQNEKNKSNPLNLDNLASPNGQTSPNAKGINHLKQGQVQYEDEDIKSIVYPISLQQSQSQTQLKKTIQKVQKQNLLTNFSKILQQNAKKYNCDTKILHSMRNPAASPYHSSQRTAREAEIQINNFQQKNKQTLDKSNKQYEQRDNLYKIQNSQKSSLLLFTQESSFKKIKNTGDFMNNLNKNDYFSQSSGVKLSSMNANSTSTAGSEQGLQKQQSNYRISRSTTNDNGFEATFNWATQKKIVISERNVSRGKLTTSESTKSSRRDTQLSYGFIGKSGEISQKNQGNHYYKNQKGTIY